MLAKGSSTVEKENEDPARTVEDSYHPQVSVTSADVGSLGCVEDYIWKKEYQKGGAVHWHMLFCKCTHLQYQSQKRTVFTSQDL